MRRDHRWALWAEMGGPTHPVVRPLLTRTTDFSTMTTVCWRRPRLRVLAFVVLLTTEACHQTTGVQIAEACPKAPRACKDCDRSKWVAPYGDPYKVTLTVCEALNESLESPKGHTTLAVGSNGFEVTHWHGWGGSTTRFNADGCITGYEVYSDYPGGEVSIGDVSPLTSPSTCLYDGDYRLIREDSRKPPVCSFGPLADLMK